MTKIINQNTINIPCVQPCNKFAASTSYGTFVMYQTGTKTHYLTAIKATRLNEEQTFARVFLHANRKSNFFFFLRKFISEWHQHMKPVLLMWAKKSEINRKSEYVINYLSYWHYINLHNMRTLRNVYVYQRQRLSYSSVVQCGIWYDMCTDEVSDLQESSRMLNRKKKLFVCDVYQFTSLKPLFKFHGSAPSNKTKILACLDPK